MGLFHALPIRPTPETLRVTPDAAVYHVNTRQTSPYQVRASRFIYRGGVELDIYCSGGECVIGRGESAARAIVDARRWARAQLKSQGETLA